MKPGKQSTPQEIEDAAVLATMESGLINSTNCEAVEEALRGMSHEQVNTFVKSTCQNAKERK